MFCSLLKINNWSFFITEYSSTEKHNVGFRRKRNFDEIVKLIQKMSIQLRLELTLIK